MKGTYVSPNSTLVIPNDSRSWFVLVVYALFAIGAALISAMVFLVLTSPGLFDLDIAGGLIGVAALVLGLVFLDRIPHSVRLDSESIEIKYALSRVRMNWDQLEAPVRSTAGFVDFGAVPGTRGVWGGLTVTVKQARAILDYPSCPRFSLSADLVSELRGTG